MDGIPNGRPLVYRLPPVDVPVGGSSPCALMGDIEADLRRDELAATLRAGPAFATMFDQITASSRPVGNELFAEYRRSKAESPWWLEMDTSLRRDVRWFYSASTMRDLAVAVAVAAPVANSSLDQRFHDWCQSDGRGPQTDRFASVWKTLGEGKYMLPMCGFLAVSGLLLDDVPALELPGEFGRRATRAYLVGGPPMLLMQYTLGASRPGETRFDSRWRPFADVNAVSGHAFIGAVPCITAAQMTDNAFAKAVFYGCSTLPAWSRINDDAHYLSQACLGWYMAYLACRSIDRTERDLPSTEVFPLAGPDIHGIGLVWRR